jgi:hypothetical protein
MAASELVVNRSGGVKKGPGVRCHFETAGRLDARFGDSTGHSKIRQLSKQQFPAEEENNIVNNRPACLLASPRPWRVLADNPCTRLCLGCTCHNQPSEFPK